MPLRILFVRTKMCLNEIFLKIPASSHTSRYLKYLATLKYFPTLGSYREKLWTGHSCRSVNENSTLPPRLWNFFASHTSHEPVPKHKVSLLRGFFFLFVWLQPSLHTASCSLKIVVNWYILMQSSKQLIGLSKLSLKHKNKTYSDGGPNQGLSLSIDNTFYVLVAYILHLTESCPFS